MAKFSQKQGGKEVGAAEVYAKPHGVLASKAHLVDPNTLSADQTTVSGPARRVSMGNPAADNTKTSGIKIRGTGAATKGVIARGPMA